MESRTRWAAFLLVGVVTFLVYLPSLSNGFVKWDDDQNFEQNEHYRGLGPSNLEWMFTHFHVGHYQPLSWLTLGLDYVIWGMNPFGYHLTNVILHALSAMVLASLVAGMFRTAVHERPAEAPRPGRDSLRSSHPGPGGGGARTGGSTVLFGVIVSLAWSLHPLRVEGVTWITERREVLCGLLTLLALSSHFGNRPRWQTAVFAACAMLAKATAVTIPVIVVLIDLHRDRSAASGGLLRAAWRAIARHWDLVLLAAITSVVAILAQRESKALVSYESLPLVERLALFFFGSAFYLAKSLWPSELAPLHQGTIGATWEFQAFVWWGAGAGLVLAIAAVLFGWMRRRSGLGFFLLTLAYLAMIAPAGGLGQSGPHVAAERYSYQPGWVLTFGIGWLLAAKTGWLTRGTLRAAVPAGLVLAALAGGSVVQQRYWFDTESLWRREVEVHPDNLFGNYQLGLHYMRRHRDEADWVRAEALFRHAVAIDPSFLDAPCALGFLLQKTNRSREALDVFEDVLRRPNHLTAPLLSLGGTLQWQFGKRDEALATFTRMTIDDPRDPEVWRQLARVQAAAGMPRDAIATFERGMAVAPHPILDGDLAWLLATHPDAAIRDGRRALALAQKASSRDAISMRMTNIMAAACAEAGEFEQGRRVVEVALAQLPPEKAPVLRSLLASLERREPIRATPAFP